MVLSHSIDGNKREKMSAPLVPSHSKSLNGVQCVDPKFGFRQTGVPEIGSTYDGRSNN